MTTPSLQLRTMFVLDDDGRILSTREPGGSRGPLFCLVRGRDACAKSIARPSGVSVIEDEALLAHGFGGFLPGEIAAGRSPVMAILEGGRPVSVCYCARASSVAAEAGVDTAEAWRGRGFGPRVVAAWALAVQASGRIPLYSTAWTNGASLAVARKLGLSTYASDWSLYD
jgi:hypothetical protein